MASTPAPTEKVGPAGGTDGTVRDMDITGVTRIVKISIRHSPNIDAFAVTFLRNGLEEQTEQWGGNAGILEEFNLEPSEYITSVKGTTGTYDRWVVVRSLKFETNLRSYGPYGVEDGDSFEFSANDGQIIGFHGRSGGVLDAIGVYVQKTLSIEPTFTIFNRAADGDYCLAIRGRKVVVALYNPPDPYQQWIRKDTATKDNEDQPAFVLVNKATNEAIWHNGTQGPVSLVRYDAGSMDNAVLWSESKNENQGYRYIRKASAISITITANNHEIHDGRIVDLTGSLHEWWKFVPYSKEETILQQTMTISCLSKAGHNLTINDNTVMLAPADSRDRNQVWIKNFSYGKQVKDADNLRPFVLVNKATGKAIKHGFGPGYLVELVPFNPDYLDASLLWTEGDNNRIRMQTNTSAVFHAFYVHQPDSNKALLALRKRNDSNDQRWKFQEAFVWDAADISRMAPATIIDDNPTEPIIDDPMPSV